jgi:hypothetical protein
MTVTVRPPIVVLTESEVQLVTFEAARRGMDALRSGHRPKAGAAAGPNGYTDAVGCAGELAVCKFLGLFWSGVGSHRTDVGGSLQVRTADAPTKRLIVRPCDVDRDAFVFVTIGRAPRPGTLAAEIHGWILAVDAKSPEYLRAEAGRDPAYFVPAVVLHSIYTLRPAEDPYGTR